MEILGLIIGVFGLVGIPALVIWMIVRVLHKAGRSGWWVLSMFVPLVNIITIWLFAFARWPALETTGEALPEVTASGSKLNAKDIG